MTNGLPLIEGSYQRVFDHDRLRLPTSWAAATGEGVIIIPWMEGLQLWPLATFGSVERRLMEMTSSAGAARQMVRSVMAKAHHDVPDTKGRIVIPSVLRQHLHDPRVVLLTGVIDHADILSAESNPGH